MNKKKILSRNSPYSNSKSNKLIKIAQSALIILAGGDDRRKNWNAKLEKQILKADEDENGDQKSISTYENNKIEIPTSSSADISISAHVEYSYESF